MLFSEGTYQNCADWQLELEFPSFCPSITKSIRDIKLVTSWGIRTMNPS